MIDTTNAQIRRLSELIKGYRATIKNTIEKTTPKDFSEDCLIAIWLVVSGIDMAVLLIKIASSILIGFKPNCTLGFLSLTILKDKSQNFV